MLTPIQVSDNPQTFHQVLLQISSLIHLVPEAVLGNFMPIFIFMGSSVLCRDDEYSSKVVQKVGINEAFSLDLTNLPQTIDSVLPVMTSSLRSGHTNSVGLHVALRDLLPTSHMPRTIFRVIGGSGTFK